MGLAGAAKLAGGDDRRNRAPPGESEIVASGAGKENKQLYKFVGFGEEGRGVGENAHLLSAENEENNKERAGSKMI